jgi:predicted DNA-binding protein
MISFELPKKAQVLLKQIAEHEGKSENDVAFDALMERIEDWYDAQIIAERMSDGPAECVSLDDVKRDLELTERLERPAAE